MREMKELTEQIEAVDFQRKEITPKMKVQVDQTDEEHAKVKEEHKAIFLKENALNKTRNELNELFKHFFTGISRGI